MNKWIQKALAVLLVLLRNLKHKQGEHHAQ